MEGERSATVTTTTGSPGSSPASTSAPVRNTAPPTSLFSIPADRQAVQVIQQAVQRPQSMAAQYLQQMYAAQQQHLMLQTAALQQQQQQQQHLAGSQLQSLANVQQASLAGSRQSPSSSPAPSESVPPSPGAAQTSITLPAAPVTQQLIGRTQSGSSSTSAGTVSQQAMLLGNGSPACSQAQVYLRTQMLILTPAATMTTVQPELPVVSSASTQVQSLALRTQPPGSMPAAHTDPLKTTTQGQMVASPLPKSPTGTPGNIQLPEATADGPGTETRGNDVSRLPPAHQLVVPSPYSAVQSQSLVKHQLHCSPGHKGAHHQLIIQQPTASHRHVQHIALRVTAQETPPCQHGLSVPTLDTPTPGTIQSQHNTVSLPPPSNSEPVLPETVVVSTAAPQSPTCQSPTLIIQPQPPVLLSTPSHLDPEPLPQSAPMSSPVPLTQVSPPPVPPPASLQRLSLQSVQALAAQSGQMLLSEEELPVAEALVQMPFQNLPPPQTIAVDLKVQPIVPAEAPLPAQQLCKVEGVCAADAREDRLGSPQRNRTPTPPTLSPSADLQRHCNDVSPHSDHCTAVSGFSCVPSTGNASVIRSSGDPPYINRSPPPLLPAVVRSVSKHPPASLPGGPESQPPQAIVKPHILTHLIEGFVIQEGLEPFPVSRSLQGVDRQTTLPEAQETKANGAQTGDIMMDTEQPENSSDSDGDEVISVAAAGDAVDGVAEEQPEVLQCEFCGKTGYAHMFLRSKRFCSMTCVRRFNVSCTKRIGLLKADKAARWSRRTDGRRGRPPRRIDGGSRDHFLRQVAAPYSSGGEHQPSHEEDDEEEEEEPPVPMTTRLRRQTERERVRERNLRASEALDGSDGMPVPASNPTVWSVEEVWSFIYNLPGCQDIAEEFRSQEIDGQALLLLTEEHLMGAMNIKLGPALKICACINSLKEP
ncbi:polyhomeotic-like protein 3 isoform X2 [Brienomyrus brachyistius]|uniref:polyhomeotic-like protein 3 isoform X2 n=1 Tax=Brienomyrus brachyistius TaxID=42636 RepID=UPI0020B1ECAC|nr:polyhomeotic-like protein 3 isoform X2 [Brienomyrus brachyistius]